MDTYSVLVVEDDEVTRRRLADFVAKERFEVSTAADGREALEILEKTKIDIVITDFKMPHVDGLELLHIAKRRTRDCEVILCTAHGEADMAISALREGAIDYIKKPIDLNQLITALGRAREAIMIKKKAKFFPCLLLAEDETTTRERLVRVLENEGWSIVAVADGEEALNVFKSRKIDIVLSDIKMPRKDGLQTLREMREVSDDFEAIILSGYGDESSAIEALRSGAISFLKKPIDLDEVIVAVEKAVEKLTVKRSLKYRMREVELSNEIIANISGERGVVIAARGSARNDAWIFANQLLDAMPLGLLVLDRDLNIRFINRCLAQMLTAATATMDSEFVAGLQKAGIEGLTCDILTAAVSRAFDSSGKNAPALVTVGKDDAVMVMPVMFQCNDEKESMVLVLIRGQAGKI